MTSEEFEVIITIAYETALKLAFKAYQDTVKGLTREYEQAILDSRKQERLNRSSYLGFPQN